MLLYNFLSPSKAWCYVGILLAKHFAELNEIDYSVAN